MPKLDPITTETQESDLSPQMRVRALTEEESRSCLKRLVESLMDDKDTRKVPAILQSFRLLAQFEVYDADHAWTQLEDEIRQLRDQG